MISKFSNHLFNFHQIQQWCYAEEPFKVVWAVRDDGIMLSFTYLKEQDIFILEIGVSGGGSLKMWYEYFPNATIIGLDINDESELSNDRTHVYQLDQSNDYQLESFVKQCEEKGYEFDIIIDDGSHHMRDQQVTLGYLFPLLKSKGIYVIEDLHTCHMQPYLQGVESTLLVLDKFNKDGKIANRQFFADKYKVSKKVISKAVKRENYKNV